MKLTHALLAALCASGPAFSQTEARDAKVFSADTKEAPANARPPAKPKTVGKSANVKVKLPALDREKLPAAPEKKIRGAGQQRKQEAIGGVQALPEAVVVTSPPGAGWEKLADGRWLWTGEVSAEGAKGIRLHVTDLKLPVGAALRVFAPGSGEAEMDHTAATLNGRTEVWTETVFGNTAAIEIVLPANWGGEPVSAKIGEVVNRWKEAPRAAAASEDPIVAAAAAGNCNLDVSCFPAWVNTSKAVVGFSVVTQPLEILCTGTLLSDSNAAPGTDYLLTANHCARNQTEADTLEFYWLYQTANCNGAAPAINSVPRTVGGARLIATSDELLANDFSFLRLNNPPPAGVTYAGWTTAAPSGAVTGIHHPNGDFKRISFGTTTSDDHFWRVVWNQGTTEVGSSGSPLLDTNQRVVGQLLGGEASCANLTGPDWFGRFDVTFASIGSWLLNQPTTVANDNFAAARVITGATGSVASTSAGATKEANEPNHAGNAGGMSVWYKWTAPSGGRYVFTTGGSGFDTVLSVYVGNTVDSLNQVARGDDSFGLTSAATFNAIAGGVYYIAVDGYGGAGGSVQLNWGQVELRSFGSSAPVTIRDLNTASPYPSTITIGSVPGVIAELGVRLEGLQHGYLSDVGVLLEAPTGEAILLMDYTGSGASVNHNFLFHPQATDFLPPEGPVPNNGTWRPTTYFDETFFTAPAPEPPFDFDLNAVFGADPNGTWRLFIEDFEQGDAGSLARWQIDLGMFTIPLRITELRELGPNSLEVRWRAIPAYDYQVLYKNELTDPTWQVLDTKTASSDGTSFVAPNDSSVRRFYQIRQL